MTTRRWRGQLAVALAVGMLVYAAPAAQASGDAGPSAGIQASASLTAAIHRLRLNQPNPEYESNYGQSVAVYGDTALVGDTFGDNADPVSGDAVGDVFVFHRSGNTWTPQQKLVALDGYIEDFFGWSLALDGDTAVIGAILAGDAFGAGAAYVFVRSGDHWGPQARLSDSDHGVNSNFGSSVAVSGDTIVVGAPAQDTSAGTDAGSASVFVRSGTTWSQQAELRPTDAAAGDYFGNSVALDGNTALIGASGHSASGAGNNGAAYVFQRSGTAWSQQQELTSSDATDTDQFGFSVGLDGNTAVLGSPGHTTAAGLKQGSAYVFTRSGGLWSQRSELFGSASTAGDQFGYSVALAGRTAVVGAPYARSPRGLRSGTSYLFAGSGATWSQQALLFPADAPAVRTFGFSVSTDGTSTVIGAPPNFLATPNGLPSAYIYFK